MKTSGTSIARKMQSKIAARLGPLARTAAAKSAPVSASTAG
jgi:hypothetical protein